MNKFYTIFLAAIFICFSGCKSKVDEVKPRPSAIQVASDPSNYGYHSRGQTEGMCYGFAINLMYRLNNETDAHAWIMLVVGIGDPQPTAPPGNPNPFLKHQSVGNGMWGHAIVLFTLDDKLYAVDENVDGPVEINLNKVDWTLDDPAVSLADVAVKELWATKTTKYPFAWDSFKASAPTFEYGKQDVFNDFGKDANDYFTMQNHAYYFPPDWCVD